MIKILINDCFKKYLLNQPSEYRKKVRQKFEYLEIGYWEGGLNVKKLKSLAGNKAVFDNQGNQILADGVSLEQLDLDGFAEFGSPCETCMYWWTDGITAELPDL